MKNFSTYINEKLKITKKKLNNNHNGHEYVDLELPSGTLWATCNVGADEEYDSGDYFAWGETYTKKVYGSATYKFNNSQIKELEPENDAAHVNMGGKWHIPTEKQWEELLSLKNVWVENYKNKIQVLVNPEEKTLKFRKSCRVRERKSCLSCRFFRSL